MSITEIMRIERVIKTRYDVRIKLFHSDTLDDTPMLSLISIVIPASDRRQGIGTLIMSYLCREADAYGWSIDLDASSRLGTNTETLVEFYSRFGFVITGYNSLEEPTMTREPLYKEWYQESTAKSKSTLQMPVLSV